MAQRSIAIKGKRQRGALIRNIYKKRKENKKIKKKEGIKWEEARGNKQRSGRTSVSNVQFFFILFLDK
jgi:hypothetical protein